MTRLVFLRGWARWLWGVLRKYPRAASFGASLAGFSCFVFVLFIGADGRFTIDATTEVVSLRHLGALSDFSSPRADRHRIGWHFSSVDIYDGFTLENLGRYTGTIYFRPGSLIEFRKLGADLEIVLTPPDANNEPSLEIERAEEGVFKTVGPVTLKCGGGCLPFTARLAGEVTLGQELSSHAFTAAPQLLGGSVSLDLKSFVRGSALYRVSQDAIHLGERIDIQRNNAPADSTGILRVEKADGPIRVVYYAYGDTLLRNSPGSEETSIRAHVINILLNNPVIVLMYSIFALFVSDWASRVFSNRR